MSCDGCGARVQTGNILKRANRAWFARDGWIRGGGKGRRRNDYCPTCAPAERERCAEEKRMKAERIEARRAAKKARAAGEKKPRRSRAAESASP
jgi:hypothetical protein